MADVIDAVGPGMDGTGDIQGGEGPLRPEKAVLPVAGIAIDPYHLPEVIDVEDLGGHTAGDIQGGEGPLRPEKAV
jgi:hypothetical protein